MSKRLRDKWNWFCCNVLGIHDVQYTHTELSDYANQVIEECFGTPVTRYIATCKCCNWQDDFYGRDRRK